MRNLAATGLVTSLWYVYNDDNHDDDDDNDMQKEDEKQEASRLFIRLVAKIQHLNIQSGPKKWATDSWPQFCQIWVD